MVKNREAYWEIYDQAIKDPLSISQELWNETAEFFAKTHAVDELHDMIVFNPYTWSNLYKTEEDYWRDIKWIAEMKRGG